MNDVMLTHYEYGYLWLCSTDKSVSVVSRTLWVGWEASRSSSQRDLIFGKDRIFCDEEGISVGIIRIGFDEFQQLLHENRLFRTCPACGHEGKWALMGGTIMPDVPLVNIQVQDIHDPQKIRERAIVADGKELPEDFTLRFAWTNIPILMMVCDMCGFMKSHSAVWLRKKIDRKNGFEIKENKDETIAQE